MMDLDMLRAIFSGSAEGADLASMLAEAKTDPDAGRALLLALFSAGSDSPGSAFVLSAVLRAGTMQLIATAAFDNDTFALHMAELIIDGLAVVAERPTEPRPARPSRGRARKVRAA